MNASHLDSLGPHLFPAAHSLWSHHRGFLKMVMLPPCFRHPKAHHSTLEPKVLAEFTRSAKAHHLLPLSLYLHGSNLLVFFLSDTPSMAFVCVNALYCKTWSITLYNISSSGHVLSLVLHRMVSLYPSDFMSHPQWTGPHSTCSKVRITQHLSLSWHCPIYSFIVRITISKESQCLDLPSTVCLLSFWCKF